MVSNNILKFVRYFHGKKLDSSFKQKDVCMENTSRTVIFVYELCRILIISEIQAIFEIISH